VRALGSYPLGALDRLSSIVAQRIRRADAFAVILPLLRERNRKRYLSIQACRGARRIEVDVSESVPDVEGDLV